MKYLIRRIDRALKRLYGLRPGVRAESFLLRTRPAEEPSQAPGAVYLRADGNDGVRIGIYFEPKVVRTLEQISLSSPHHPQSSDLEAFSLATEEVSHFHYLLHHAVQGGRAVSRVELEAQGEIDQFLLAYYSLAGKSAGGNLFDQLFERMFLRFGWSSTLSGQERQTYEEANSLARRFVLWLRPHFGQLRSADRTLKQLRHFYTLDQLEKEKFLKSA